jgi:hypothetical protein
MIDSNFVPGRRPIFRKKEQRTKILCYSRLFTTAYLPTYLLENYLPFGKNSNERRKSKVLYKYCRDESVEVLLTSLFLIQQEEKTKKHSLSSNNDDAWNNNSIAKVVEDAGTNDTVLMKTHQVPSRPSRSSKSSSRRHSRPIPTPQLPTSLLPPCPMQYHLVMLVMLVVVLHLKK